MEALDALYLIIQIHRQRRTLSEGASRFLEDLTDDLCAQRTVVLTHEAVVELRDLCERVGVDWHAYFTWG